MHIYASPRRGYCASCEVLLPARPVYHLDEAYCCIGCAKGGPCLCSYEADLASDGVDHLGLPFAMTGAAEPAPAAVPSASRLEKDVELVARRSTAEREGTPAR